jgi:hypothetical protein
VTRRELLAGFAPAFFDIGKTQSDPGFRLVNVTSAAGINFVHNSGAFGGKYLPETMGSGCAFLDYDNDGWQDILLINGMDWPGHTAKGRSSMKLYRNNRNGTFTDVTAKAGLDLPMYGMGIAAADFNNDGFVDLLITCVGQSRLFRNTGRGTFVDVTEQAGLGGHSGFSTSALWFDYDRDGHLDLLICNYVRWSPASDVFCSMDGRRKSYCTPEAYRGSTCWLFHNRGNGTFEDVTAKSGLFDASSKSLGVALIDYDHDGWPDIFIANDTQPNKLYRNNRDGTFQDVAIKAGVAFSEDGKARAGMGVDAGDFENSGSPGLVVTNFDNEMIALYRAAQAGQFVDIAPRTEIGTASRKTLGFGCFFFDVNLDTRLDLLVVNGHIDDTVRNVRHETGYDQAPQLFLNEGGGRFRDVAREVGAEFATPKVARGAAYGDFDNDGDLDVLLTTNNGPARLYRNDVQNGNRSLRIRLAGTRSNRDGIGAMVKATLGSQVSTATIRSGSSYLSQSELPVTFGLGPRDQADLIVIYWPSGRVEEYRNIRSGRWLCTEGQGIKPDRT